MRFKIKNNLLKKENKNFCKLNLFIVMPKIWYGIWNKIYKIVILKKINNVEIEIKHALII